jgi:hypothetical protein
MVSIVNSVCFLKEFCLLLTAFLDEQHHFCAESPLSMNRRSTVALVREGLMLQGRGFCTLLTMVN